MSFSNYLTELESQREGKGKQGRGRGGEKSRGKGSKFQSENQIMSPNEFSSQRSRGVLLSFLLSFFQLNFITSTWDESLPLQVPLGFSDRSIATMSTHASSSMAAAAAAAAAGRTIEVEVVVGPVRLLRTLDLRGPRRNHASDPRVPDRLR